MTRSLTLAGLPRAGANSKADHYQQKVQKMKDLPNTWGLTGKQFEDFRQQKEQKHISRPFKKTKWNTRPLNATIELGTGTFLQKKE